MKRNIWLYYLITFVLNNTFILSVWSFFGTEYLALSYFATTILFSFGDFINILMEVPTGSWADRFGRKRVYMIGLVLNVFGSLFFIFTKSYPLLLVGQIFIGTGIAIISGTLESLIYDSLVAHKQESRYKSIAANKQTFLFLGRSTAALLSGFFYAASPTFPYVGRAVTFGIIIIATLFLTEFEHKKSDALSDIEQIKRTVMELFKQLDVKQYMLMFLVFTALGNVLFIAYQPYFEQSGFSVETIGIIYIFISIFSAAGTQVVKRIDNDKNHFTILKVMLMCVVISAVLMYFLHDNLALLGPLLLSVVFGFSAPVTNNFINKQLSSDKRATGLSIAYLLQKLAFTVFASLTGILLDKTSLGFTTLFVAIITAVFLIFFQVFLNTPKHQTAQSIYGE